MKKAVSHIGALVNIRKTFLHGFLCNKMNRSAVKRPVLWYIIHICVLHSFWNINEKQEVIDTNYP